MPNQNSFRKFYSPKIPAGRFLADNVSNFKNQPHRFTGHTGGRLQGAMRRCAVFFLAAEPVGNVGRFERYGFETVASWAGCHFADFFSCSIIRSTATSIPSAGGVMSSKIESPDIGVRVLVIV